MTSLARTFGYSAQLQNNFGSARRCNVTHARKDQFTTSNLQIRFSSGSTESIIKKPLKIILVGVPGSGKGTQSAKIEKDYGSIQISTGQILRQSAASNTPYGETIKKQMLSGGLVSDDIMLELIKTALSDVKYKKNGWILDGFPRTMKQASQLDSILATIQQPLDFVFYLDVPEASVIDRIKERFVHPASGRVYNTSFNPPREKGKDDITGEPLIRREDDDSETVRSRLRNYKDSTQPMLDFYKRDNRLITIDSPTSAIGYVELKRILDKHMST